ncbi:hypothetical protein L3V83_02315 [Thiotrichales bacterium 19X7-9]|nr:hypothetical protein [Thiotrichales bacterium 19X7-9]
MTKYTFIPFTKEESNHNKNSLLHQAKNWRKGQINTKGHPTSEWPKVKNYTSEPKRNNQLAVNKGDKIYVFAHGLQGTCQITNTISNCQERKIISPEELVNRLIENGLPNNKPFQINLFLCQSGTTYNPYQSNPDPSLANKVIAGEVTRILRDRGYRNINIVGYTEPLQPKIRHNSVKGKSNFSSFYTRRHPKTGEILRNQTGRAKDVKRVFSIDNNGTITDSIPDQNSLYHNNLAATSPSLSISSDSNYSLSSSPNSSSSFDFSSNSASTPQHLFANSQDNAILEKALDEFIMEQALDEFAAKMN